MNTKLDKYIDDKAKESYAKQLDPEQSSYESFFHYTDELLFSAGFKEGFSFRDKMTGKDLQEFEIKNIEISKSPVLTCPKCGAPEVKNEHKMTKYECGSLYYHKHHQSEECKWKEEFLDEEHTVVQWPDSQMLMDEDWFEEEAQLINDEYGLGEYGGTAYIVPKKYLK